MGKRHSRNEALFGGAGQAKISETNVAIVGLGGLGSHVAQQLAYLGVVDHTLIDFDFVTESSLNRLVGALPVDVAAHVKKVIVAERTITSVQPEATVAVVDGRITDVGAEQAVARCDVVFGCLDRDIHRLELLELTTRHAKPYFDLATDVDGEGDYLVYGGRVVICDGSRCLVCLPDLLDQKAIARDRLSPELRDADRRIYGIRRDALAGTSPAVVSINGVVASLAVTEFMVWRAGLREPAGLLTYRADLGVVRRSRDEPARDCYYCRRLWAAAMSGGGGT